MKENNEKSKLIGWRGRKQRGYTLLEYCAGAAVIAGIVWVAMVNLGGAMNTYLENLSEWLRGRGALVTEGGSTSTAGATGGTTSGTGSSN